MLRNMTAHDRFSRLTSRLKKNEGYWVEIAKDDIADEIYSIMEREEVSQAELARRMDTSRQYITKMLGGGVNLTIESLVKVGLALGYRLRTESLFIPLEEEHRECFATQTEPIQKTDKLKPSMLSTLSRIQNMSIAGAYFNQSCEALNYASEDDVRREEQQEPLPLAA